MGVKFMKMLEFVSDKIYKGYFVDLFVRKSNDVAVDLYTKLGKWLHIAMNRNTPIVFIPR